MFFLYLYTVYMSRLELLSRADGTEIATDIVTEVCEVAFSIIYSHYLEKQAFPHTINDARHSLLKIIEVRKTSDSVDSLHLLYIQHVLELFSVYIMHDLIVYIIAV